MTVASPSSLPPAVILLSGGLDSTTVLAIAKAQGYAPYALSFRYGQRHEQELHAAEAVVAQVQGQVVAFALFFTNFSTFLGLPGLYLEDLYVQPAHRGTGLGKALLQHLGALAVERGCGRFEWSVLDWNENAIRFYEKMGATVMPDWRICRVTGDALAALGRR